MSKPRALDSFTFWGWGRCGAWDVLGLGTFWGWDVMGWGRFRVGTFWGLRRFWGLGRFEAQDVLRLRKFWGSGRFQVGMFWGLGRFVLGHSVVGCFVGASNFQYTLSSSPYLLKGFPTFCFYLVVCTVLALYSTKTGAQLHFLAL